MNGGTRPVGWIQAARKEFEGFPAAVRDRAFGGALRPVLAAAAAAFWAAGAGAGMDDEPLADRLARALPAIFPEADSLGPVAGDPPAAPALAGGEAVGYLFSTHEAVRPRGFSGQSFDIAVGIDLAGAIRGHLLLEEREPMIDPGIVTPGGDRPLPRRNARPRPRRRRALRAAPCRRRLRRHDQRRRHAPRGARRRRRGRLRDRRARGRRRRPVARPRRLRPPATGPAFSPTDRCAR